MCNIKKKSINYRYLVAFLLTLVFVNVFTIIYIKQERYVYNWDLVGYWEQYAYIGRNLVLTPIATIKSIVTSVRYNDYNYLPVLPLLPFYYLFGESRIGYILAISNIYLVPSIIILTFLSEKIINSYRQNIDLTIFSLILLTIATFGSLWIPTLRGYPDVGGIFFIGLILLIYEERPPEKQNMILLFLTALFLFIISINRRYYNFWVLAFFAAAFLERFSFIAINETKNYRDYLKLIRNLFIICVVYIILYFIISGPLLKKQVTTDWSNVYGAYKHNLSWLQRALDFPNHFGLLFSILSILGLFFSIRIRRIRYFVFFIALQAVITIIAFTRVQSFDFHQYLLISSALLILAAIFIERSVSFFKNSLPRNIYIVIYLAFIISLFANTFIPNFTVPRPVAFLFPQKGYKPLIRGDMEEIRKLVEFVERLSANKPAATYYVLASSEVLNSSIMKNAVRAYDEDSPLILKIHETADLDRRDGFPIEFFDSRYVIVAVPAQYHLGKQDQKVISIPDERILNKAGIGMNYKKLPESFNLDQDVKVYIYEKEKPPDYQEIEEVLNEFLTYYPDFKTRYSILPLNLFLTEESEAVKNTGMVFSPDSNIVINLSGDSPARAEFSFKKDLKKIKIRPSLHEGCNRSSKVELNMTGDGKEIFRHTVEGTLEETYDIDLNGVDLLNLAAVNTGPQPCESMKIKVLSEDWKTN
jgi:hypothetical protein